MARKKISTTIYITPEQNQQLKLLHERTKVPVAVYIRETGCDAQEESPSPPPGVVVVVEVACAQSLVASQRGEHHPPLALRAL